jgi:hypothetical protein
MKNNRIISISRCMAILALLILAQSCLEYTVTTTVNKDGSLFREYKVKGDSSKIFSGSLFIPSGEGWKISRAYEKSSKSGEKSGEVYVYTASRKFSNVKELQQWIDSDTSDNHIRVQVALKKRFRWFFSYYEYTETYPMLFPFKKVPADQCLTKIEQSVVKEDGNAVYSPAEKKMIWRKDSLKFAYNRGDSIAMKVISDECEKKLEGWMALSIVTEFTELLKDSFAHDPSITALADKMAKSRSLIDTIRQMSGDTLICRTLIAQGDLLAGNHRLSDLYAQNRKVFRDFEDKFIGMKKIDFTDDFEYSLGMPGTVFSTNADDRSHDQMHWKFGHMNSFMNDYVMQTTSRVPNIGFMVLTGIVAVVLFLVLLSRRK